MKIIRKRGDTSNILQIFIQDSSSTTGAGLTALANNTSGLTAYYHKDTDTTATAITLATMTVGTFTSSGFKEIDATNMPGWYQFCPPDASLSASGTPHSVGYHLKGATNMAPLAIECQLIAADVEDTTRLGLTALPNAAAEAAGGLYTRGTGAGQINQDANGRVDANLKTIAAQTVTCAGGVTVPAATLASTTNITAGTMTTTTNLTTNNDKTGYALTAGERTSVADALLDRDMSTGADSGSTTVRTMRQALRFLRNKWSISAGTLTVCKEDDSTSSWTAAVTTDGTALPITANDPAGP